MCLYLNVPLVLYDDEDDSRFGTENEHHTNGRRPLLFYEGWTSSLKEKGPAINTQGLDDIKLLGLPLSPSDSHAHAHAIASPTPALVAFGDGAVFNAHIPIFVFVFVFAPLT